jgi:hypothetical protein
MRRASCLSSRMLPRLLMLLLLAAGAGQRLSAAIFVRPSVSTLTAAQIASLRAGFQAMQNRSIKDPNDPTGLSYQAAIHGMMMASMDPVLQQCQHGSYLFLAWHRMYLYYFERILRQASGDPTLALPYWNYEDPTQNALPDIFRLPANGTNSLYTTHRGPGINAATAKLRPGDVDDTVAMADPNFDSPTGSSASFGGQIVAGPMHVNKLHGELETQPHDAVHVRLGGWMGDTDTAAQDPIFWLHHANIDRLWKRWLAQGGGRSDPLLDQVWMTTNFTFYDENKNKVTLNGSQVIDTLSQLGYRYDDDPPPPVPIPQFIPYYPSHWPPPQPPCECPYLLEVNTLQVLTQQPVTVTLPLNSSALAAINQVLGNSSTAPPLSLRVEGIQSSVPPGVTFEIYLNLPSGTSNAQFGSPSYLGNLALFGMSGQHTPQGGGAAAFRLNTALKNLQAAGLWNSQTLSVTFISRGPLPPSGQPDTSPAPAGTQSFSSLAIVEEQ